MYGHTSTGGVVRSGRTSYYAHHRGNRLARSVQTIVFLARVIEQVALHCVLFVHDNATRILVVIGGDGMSPFVRVSCAATLKNMMAGSGTRRGVFVPYVKSKTCRAPMHTCQDFASRYGGTVTTFRERNIRSRLVHTRLNSTGMRARVSRFETDR